ncbi:methyltransferase [Aerococcus urinaehominis]|uniref:tRNA 5-hydroxyuridine methyltransferase n=1 Tax=Aerococcus urinaehominis TaxID=128944 RepID=A0A109RHQ1_9LACT|nr:O-methyltransferase [Aerococcus urinaehominis]AMB99191.1 methyltransferase [Aerococcus urinaehominis]SDM32843.1 Predicted O-methyltransferase YrrM [Aerococcus urinaehominis]
MHKQNEMMDRPIVEAGVLNYLRYDQRRFASEIQAIEYDANERRVPIIPHETAVFLDFLLGLMQPQQILEIGLAIGYSASLMTYGHPGRHVDSIERNLQMVAEAKENISKLGLDQQITILEGDAKEVLASLDKAYDFIFMDSAKAKYYDFLPYLLNLLPVGGLIMIDDVFQAGTVFHERTEIPRRVRTIHKKLNMLLEKVTRHPQLKTTALPLGDGVLLIEKKADFDYFKDFTLDQVGEE